ncbi:hypothetical protein [Methanoculleus chikugoensis]|uniref:hypothetical protein n=1 Tax=Methanoculleus chikugoensis TaxID=118126 RepID=UPI000B06C57E|nr:hypothetical protein [Methanoculleus chikugoensis]
MGTLIPLVVLVIVFLLIAVRKIGNVNFRIWQVMLLGAAAVLATGSIAPLDALASINLDVMLFLFFMFVIGGGTRVERLPPPPLLSLLLTGGGRPGIWSFSSSSAQASSRRS